MGAAVIGERLGAGKEAEVFAFGPNVVKLYPAGRGKAAVFREAATLALVERLALPAPRVEAVDCFDGRWGLVMSRVEGRSFADHLADGAADVAAVVDAAARLQSRLHHAPGAGLADHKARLAGEIAAAPGLPAGLRRDILARLAGLPAGDRLVHGDFHVHNIIGALDDGVIVDWLDAACGLPAADACRTHLLLLRDDPALAARHLDSYCRMSGIARAAILDWLPILAAARLAERVAGDDEFLAGLASTLSDARG